MALVVPTALVSSMPGELCTDIAQVPTDSMSTIGQFHRQMALGLLAKGKLLTSLTYKGAPVLGDAKMHHYASTSKEINFAASYMTLKNAHPKGADPHDQMVLRIKPATGKEFTLPCRRSWPVAKLKWAINDLDEAAYPIHQQRLLVDGKLMNDTCTLADYGAKRSKTVHMVLGVSGGSSTASVSFADVSNPASLGRVPFAVVAPRWRTAIKGLNVEGVCQNISCGAYGQCVIDPKGMVAFCLHGDFGRCPECDTRFMPTTCGFWDCKWAYDGTKVTDMGPEPVSNQWTVAAGFVYHRFQEVNNTLRWHFLVITARPMTGDAGGLCPVCWEPAVGAHCNTPCAHTFHPQCLAALKRDMPASGSSCPSCHEHI